MEDKQDKTLKWDWLPCNYNLKLEYKKSPQIWKLQPSILLTNPYNKNKDPLVKLYLDTEKSLNYSEQIGWNWHKSWNLPNISIRIDIKERDSQEPMLCPRNLYAHIFAAKAVIDQPDEIHLIDVGIRGQSKLQMVNGQAFFSGLKFYTTSYINEGVKFHLVLVVYIEVEGDETPHILNSTISPPIFVDSRKSARDQAYILEKKMLTFISPFLPECLNKEYIKRENKKKSDQEIMIYNNNEGLFNYLTAPNIRHKFKHPLFLIMKFSSCCKLYFNTSQIKDQSYKNLFEILQRNITQDHYVPLNNQKFKQQNTLFILFIDQDQGFRFKKINESIQPLVCQTLGIVYDFEKIPLYFAPLIDSIQQLKEVRNIYQQNYKNYLDIVNQVKNSQDLKNEEDNSEGEELISPYPDNKIEIISTSQESNTGFQVNPKYQLNVDNDKVQKKPKLEDQSAYLFHTKIKAEQNSPVKTINNLTSINMYINQNNTLNANFNSQGIDYLMKMVLQQQSQLNSLQQNTKNEENQKQNQQSFFQNFDTNLLQSNQNIVDFLKFSQQMIDQKNKEKQNN